MSFRPVETLVAQADERLIDAEGHALERLAAILYEERSRLGLGDFSLTQQVKGWWDRNDTELDLVTLNDDERILRLGTCKRSPERLVKDLGRFDGHIQRFLSVEQRYRDWMVERVAIAPALSEDQRKAIQAAGYIPQDLVDLTQGLSPGSKSP